MMPRPQSAHAQVKLSAFEQALLRDLRRRPTHLALFNALLCLAAVAVLCWLQPADIGLYLLCTLCGIFPGVWLAQSHQRRISHIVDKLDHAAAREPTTPRSTQSM